MNSEAYHLFYQYKTGNITAQQFSQQMRELNYSMPQIMQVIMDANNPQVKAPRIPPPDGTPPIETASAAPQPSQVRTESGTMVTPGYSPGPRFQLNDPTGQTTPTAPYVAQRFEDSGSPYVGSPYDQAGNAQRFRPQYDPGQAQRFRPDGAAVEQAIAIAKDRAPAMAAADTSRAAPQSDLLHTLIRGRFGDAAKGNPMDDRLTAFQEARDKSGEARASGGAVGGKDAALHKALEIIHHLIRTR